MTRTVSLCNAGDQSQENESLLNSVKTLLRLRKEFPALLRGGIQRIPVNGDIVMYKRYWKSQTLVVAVNVGKKTGVFKLPAFCKDVLYSAGRDVQVSASVETSLLNLSPESGALLLLREEKEVKEEEQ